MTCAWILRLLSPASMFYSYSVVYSLSFSLMGISMGLDSEGEGLRQEGFPRTAAPDGLAVSRDGSAALLGLLTRSFEKRVRSRVPFRMRGRKPEEFVR